MKYIVTHDIRCGLIVTVGTQLEINQFTFLADSEGQLAKRIQTEVEAGTKEEAQRKARQLFTQFLSKLTLVDNGAYTLLGLLSIKEGKMTTTARSISGRVSIGVDGNFIKHGFEKNLQGKHLRIRPLTHYSAGINSSDPFTQFRNFYWVLESYLGATRNITPWITGKMPSIERKEDQFGNRITIISWIRHKISHSKNDRRGLEPLLVSNPQHVELVQKYVPVVRDLARDIIREREKV